MSEELEPASHSIIIIGQHLDCIASAFPNLTTLTDTVKANAIAVDGLLTNGDPAEAEDMHEALHQLQEFAGGVCNDTANFKESEIQPELQSFNEDLEDYL